MRATQTRKKTWKLPQIQYIDKIFDVPVAMKLQVPTDPVSRTDTCDSEQKDDPWKGHGHRGLWDTVWAMANGEWLFPNNPKMFLRQPRDT